MPRIAEDVLKNIRQYLLVENGDPTIVRVERVQTSVEEVQKNPMSQKTILILEPAPIFSHNVNKGKGLVFEYDSTCSSSHKKVKPSQDSKLLRAAMDAGNAMSSKSQAIQTATDHGGFRPIENSFSVGSTVHRVGFNEPSFSGTKGKW
ncbi:unnamed protein product [Arabis nemorensis]|uniref:Uncharacterized protein n=1 Tax=Arabis nemorensis TaxID=586526 RepID=A0A565BJR9_9BRAS|nr:unnamed protein product [Arabis nemorensis]